MHPQIMQPNLKIFCLILRFLPILRILRLSRVNLKIFQIGRLGLTLTFANESRERHDMLRNFAKYFGVTEMVLIQIAGVVGFDILWTLGYMDFMEIVAINPECSVCSFNLLILNFLLAFGYV